MFKAFAVTCAGFSLALGVNGALAQEPAQAVVPTIEDTLVQQPQPVVEQVTEPVAAPVATAAPEVTGKKISLFTAIDFGRVEAGRDLRQNNYNAAGTALNRTIVNVNYVDRLDEHYLVSVGVGGIFWRAFSTSSATVDDKVIKFGPGISNAFMQWMPNENTDLTFGFFPYKYNDAANNLGEYLFRTEAYPTIIYTGGWNWINDAQYSTLGVKLTIRSFNGRLKQDFALFGEYFNSPIYDITPAYIVTAKPTDWLTVGGAGALHRYITPTPSTKRELTKKYTYRENFFMPQVDAKSRQRVDIANYAGTQAYDVFYSAGGSPNLDSLRTVIYNNDGPILSAYGINSAAEIPLAEAATGSSPGREGQYVTQLESDIEAQAARENSSLAAYAAHSNNAGNSTRTVSFDLAAVKVVAFFNLDFNRLLGWSEERMGKFNLYGEIAQLGFKDYPIFYTEKAQRRPIMLGVSVPTFGLLNSLSFEGEYLKNPNIESIASTYDNLDLPPDQNFRYGIYDKDDVKWTVHASKRVSKFITLYAQVANDHMRLKNGFTQPQYIPVTNEPSHWYWLGRIQWAL